jgi:hypothetical protein
MTTEELLACLDELLLRLRSDCGFSVPEIENALKKAVVRHVLDATHGNISRAAKLLEKHRNGLAREMKRFGFSIEQWDRKGSRGARVQDYYDSLLPTDQPERGLSQ